MAVFTEVSFEAAARLIGKLGIGELHCLTPCAGGIENTNYFADTNSGRFVLTLFERLSAAELPFYLQLMKHLADRGLPVPGPHADGSGELLFELHGKPAAVVDRLRGGHHLEPDEGDCTSVGRVLAELHLAAADLSTLQPNLRGLAWWQCTVPDVLPHLHRRLAALLLDELAFQSELAKSAAFAALPRGVVHGDLFRDNVMFDGASLTGVFDFYFAGVDTLLFDIAVALNDWCIDLASGRLVEERADALIAGYQSLRPLQDAENELLHALLRAAAFRFWLSRLWDVHLPRDAVVLKAHDPTHFERVLLQRRESPWHPAQQRAAS